MIKNFISLHKYILARQYSSMIPTAHLLAIHVCSLMNKFQHGQGVPYSVVQPEQV